MYEYFNIGFSKFIRKKIMKVVYYCLFLGQFKDEIFLGKWIQWMSRRFND